MRADRGGEGHLCVDGSDLCLDCGEQGEVVGGITGIHRCAQSHTHTQTSVSPLTVVCCNYMSWSRWEMG